MKIKSLLTAMILTASILTGEICRAQDANSEFPRNEIQVGYGFISMLSVSATILNALVFGFTQPYSPYSENTSNIYNNGSWGPLYVNYHYYPIKWLGIGLNAGYEQVNDTVSENNGLIKQINWQFLTFMLNVKIMYGWEWVKFYHGLSGGFTYATATVIGSNGSVSKDAQPIFAFHFTAFGIRVGKTVGVFADLGIGYLGIVNVGVNFVF